MASHLGIEESSGLMDYISRQGLDKQVNVESPLLKGFTNWISAKNILYESNSSFGDNYEIIIINAKKHFQDCEACRFDWNVQVCCKAFSNFRTLEAVYSGMKLDDVKLNSCYEERFEDKYSLFIAEFDPFGLSKCPQLKKGKSIGVHLSAGELEDLVRYLSINTQNSTEYERIQAQKEFIASFLDSSDYNPDADFVPLEEQYESQGSYGRTRGEIVFNAPTHLITCPPCFEEYRNHIFEKTVHVTHISIEENKLDFGFDFKRIFNQLLPHWDVLKILPTQSSFQ